ncbi:hypothetical protein TTY48_14630 [Tsukamurella sp. TY48]|uniref:hypothetical protein n=1 Tax=Tsukamurella TaxID=2060 RepID=UPI001C7D42CF|nr:hypothetical protein [Tsukamurella sp. TY48]GIZ96851.1 hypothetical protein TTY48_14630 [Tsukamurella sp. TY48]
MTMFSAARLRDRRGPHAGGPRIGIGGRIGGCVLLLLAIIQMVRGDWRSAMNFFGSALVFLADDLPSRGPRRGLRCVGFGLVAVAVTAYALDHQWFSVGVMLWAIAVFSPWIFAQRSSDTGAFRFEDLVGLTVVEAKRRIGFGEYRGPHGVDAPTLVAVPVADLDMVSPSLIVTGVVVDDSDMSMTFGVAEPDSLPAEFDRGELQRQLADRVAASSGGPLGSALPA